MTTRQRIEALERKVRRWYAPQRADYEANFKQRHEDAANRYISILSAAENAEVPEEVQRARKIERQREVGAAELKAGGTQARQEAWQAQRVIILAARAKVRRECEASGTALVFSTGEPPMLPPDTFMAPPDGTVTHHKPDLGAVTQRVNPDGSYGVELADFDAVQRKPVRRGPDLELPEDQFKRAAEAQRSSRT